MILPSPPAGWRVEGGILISPSPVISNPSYPEHVRDLLAHAEGKHFWFRSRARLIADVVAARIEAGGWLEVGCGTGYVLAEVARRYSGRCAGQDVSRPALEIARTRTDADLYFARTDDLPMRNLAGVGLFDVIEHLDDDVAALSGAAAYLKTGGVVVVTVPAHQWLWSQTDEAAGHHRRYGRRLLLVALSKAGFHVEMCRPFFSCLLPGLLARKALRFRDHEAALRALLSVPPRLVNDVFKALTELERRCFGLGIGLLGTSWLAVGRRLAPRNSS